MSYNQRGVYYIDGEWGGKTCVRCGWFRNWWEFNKHNTCFNGYASKCKKCQADFYVDKKEDRKEYYLEHREDILKQRKQYTLDNRKNRKEYNNSYVAYSNFCDRLTIEEQPRETKDGFLEVKCANSSCRKYFTPINSHVHRRLQSLKGCQTGENRLYCSEKCKQECSLFGQKKYPKGFKPESLNTEFPAFVKKEIFKRDKYECQICGRTHDLQAHHEFPGATHHMLSKDVKNGITLCKECHIKVHLLPGCSFKEISSCSRKIKKELKQKGINLNEVPDWAVDKYLKPSQLQP